MQPGLKTDGSVYKWIRGMAILWQDQPNAPGGVLGSIFAGYVPLASPNPYPIIVYSVANYRPHLSHF